MNYLLKLAAGAAALAGATIVIAQAQTKVDGSGHAKTETRSVPAFDSISAAGHMTVDVEVGHSGRLTVTADDNVLPVLQTKVVGLELQIGFKNHTNVNAKTPIKISVPVEMLKELSVAGSIQSHVQGVHGTQFKLSLAGSGAVTAEGAASKLDLSIAGSGKLNLDHLKADDATISVAGSGRANVSVKDALRADIAGSGTVRYVGSPKVKKSVMGSGSVSPMR